jgi:hypothetical protein
MWSRSKTPWQWTIRRPSARRAASVLPRLSKQTTFVCMPFTRPWSSQSLEAVARNDAPQAKAYDTSLPGLIQWTRGEDWRLPAVHNPKAPDRNPLRGLLPGGQPRAYSERDDLEPVPDSAPEILPRMFCNPSNAASMSPLDAERWPAYA